MNGWRGAFCPAGAGEDEDVLLISEKLAQAFNQQIANEFGASMQYISIAAHFNHRNLTLLSRLFLAQK